MVDLGYNYNFGYDIEDNVYNNYQSRHESGTSDPKGQVTGSYSLINPDGSRRTVDYIADWVNGFRATVSDKNGVTQHGYNTGYGDDSGAGHDGAAGGGYAGGAVGHGEVTDGAGGYGGAAGGAGGYGGAAGGAGGYDGAAGGAAGDIEVTTISFSKRLLSTYLYLKAFADTSHLTSRYKA
ncbi:hypothetical protein CHUAL_008709 [Chamberlinius hualienensis]